MQQSINGYVLPIVLMIVQIFSLLSLNSLMYTTEMITATRQFWMREQYLQTGIKILDKIGQYVSDQLPICVLEQTSTAILRKKSISWWRQYGCGESYNNLDYYYIVEDLGINPCGIIEVNKYNENMIAAYYRITLFMLLDKKGVEKLFLQSTIVRPSLDYASCSSNQHHVLLGKQMWREV